LLVNYVYDSEEFHYRYLLKKLMKYAPNIPGTLKAIICYLPKGATYVDQYYAKRIQRLMDNRELDCKAVVLFIPFHQRKKLMMNWFKTDPGTNELVELEPSEVLVKADVGNRSLLYTWGSISQGKLGLGLGNPRQVTQIPEFVREDLGHAADNYDELK
jgi:hypothetical protein